MIQFVYDYTYIQLILWSYTGFLAYYAAVILPTRHTRGAKQ